MTMTVFPTGSTALDEALGVGGFPGGRVIEVFGTASSGKDEIALRAIAAVQRSGGVVAFVGRDFDIDHATQAGIDIGALLVSLPDTISQGLEITETLVRTGCVDLIVIGALPAPPDKGDHGDHLRGLHMRYMSQMVRRLTALVSRTTSALMFLVERPVADDNIVGTALKFYASVRLDVRRSGERSARVKVVKNKMAAPFREAEVDLSAGGAA